MTARRIAGVAALIAALTIASRLAGFARTLGFTAAVGPTDLGDIYLAANTIPNVIFEMVAGGALATLVIPLLAGAVAKGDRAAVGATASALLTWTLTLLVPAGVAVALLAGPIVTVLAGPDASAAQVDAGTRMLRVFAPQLPLYGVGIVLTGVLQAHHRFAWPVIAPLLSSLVVIVAYVTFAALDGRGADLAGVSRSGELVLSVGTTLGVAVLTLCLLIPVRRLRLSLRPGYRFPGDSRAAVGGLAIAGAVTVGAQQMALLVALRYGMAGPSGTVVLYQLAQTLFLLPWAVLAVPIATAAYPHLAADAATGDVNGYRDTLARAGRGVLLASCLGAAALVALAGPGSRVLVAVMTPAPAPGELAAAVAWFAPGLLGYGLSAVLTRALYARRDTAAAALSTVVGWAAVAIASAVLAGVLPVGRRVVALAVANSIGMTVLGLVLLVVVGRRAGPSALRGTIRAGVAGLVAAALGTAAGLAVTVLTGGDTPGVWRGLAQGMLTGGAVVAVFVAVAYPLDRPDLAPLLRRVVRGAGRGAGRQIGRRGGPVG